MTTTASAGSYRGSEASEQLADRVARCLPGASFELETLARLVGIVATDQTDTAAVTCHGRSRLLLNPAFIEQHCQRDEHLFLLIMHEMWHVLLGHTTLYGRPTPAHNIAFDALINAGLTRQHQDAPYRGFFEGLNSPHLFPQLLLRAPEGWPDRPVYPKVGPKGTVDILRRLYPPRTGQLVSEPTFQEIVDLIERHNRETSQKPGRMRGRASGAAGGGREGAPGATGEATEEGETDDPYGGATLLGDHSEDGEASPLDDEVFADIVRRIVAKWPPPPFPLHGRDAGGETRDSWFEPQPSPQATRRAFTRTLKEVTLPDPKGARDTQRQLTRTTVGPGPLPNASDRLLPARRALIGKNALANQSILLPSRKETPPARALVYLDVSGSMNHILPYIIDLLAGPARRGELLVRQFSTTVEPIAPRDLAAGALLTTGGTDIVCVLEDLVEQKLRRALIVTDGYVGEAPAHLLDRLTQRGVQIHAALPEGGWERDLAPIATLHHIPHVTFTH